tara:strand:- start:2076 stop:2768 length:693 start_codon:yes stop_codon:yes gene_type:complete
MALPTIDVPTFDIEIPGMKGKVKFRPFLVKENKILTLATASDSSEEMYNACCQVINNCSLGSIEAEKLAMFQIQFIFLKLREKSIGNTQEFTLKCGKCDEVINYTMDINEFELVGDPDVTEQKLEINGEVGIVLKYPSAEVQLSQKELSDTEILLNSIEYIYDGEEVIRPEEETAEEMVAFIDSLPVNILNEAAKFFTNIPTLIHKIEYTCVKCETKNKVMVNGYEHFFG